MAQTVKAPYTPQEIDAFLKKIAPWVERLEIPKPDAEEIARRILLADKSLFLRAGPVSIALAGTTFTGKSSIINAIWGEKISDVGMHPDTTAWVWRVNFDSGLTLYDTPGAWGSEYYYENITRAFLGLDQIKFEPRSGDAIKTVSKVPIADARNFDKETGKPLALLEPSQIEKIDIIIYVVDIKGGVKGADTSFFRELVSKGYTVIVVANKIDGLPDDFIAKNLEYIQQKCDRTAIPVAAPEDVTQQKNIDQLISNIIRWLPKNRAEVLAETVNDRHRSLVRRQKVAINSLITGLMSARIMYKEDQRESAIDLVSNLLGLYSWVAHEYAVSETKLSDAGLTLRQIAASLDSKENQARIIKGTANKQTFLGSVLGITLGTAAGAAGGAFALLANVITGGVAGLGVAAVAAVVTAYFKLRKVSDVSGELEKLQNVIRTSSATELAQSTFAFGITVGKCCEVIVEEQGREIPDFFKIYGEEYSRSIRKFKPFSKRIENLQDKTFDSIVEDMYLELERP